MEWNKYNWLPSMEDGKCISEVTTEKIADDDFRERFLTSNDNHDDDG